MGHLGVQNADEMRPPVRAAIVRRSTHLRKQVIHSAVSTKTATPAPRSFEIAIDMQ